MKSTVLIVAIAAGLSLTAMDASAAGRGDRQAPDFATLDTDNSGTLSRAEIAAAGAARFAALDTDSNGVVSAEELVAGAEGRAANRADKVIAHLDANDDGVLQPEEMTRAARQSARTMSHLDANDDGEISAEEFEQIGKKRGGRGKKGGKGPKGDRN